MLERGDDYLKKLQRRFRSDNDDLYESINSYLRERYADSVKVSSISDGILTLRVSDPVLATDIRLRQLAILERLREKTGAKITGIRTQIRG